MSESAFILLFGNRDAVSRERLLRSYCQRRKCTMHQANKADAYAYNSDETGAIHLR